MQISWALIINHLNCLNLLNLRNCCISQSMKRGLGKGIRGMNFGEKSYAGGISSKVFKAAELRVFWLQRSPCFRRWVVHLSHSLLLIREFFFQLCVESISCIMVDKYIWSSTIYVIYLTCHIYMYKFALREFSLCRWRRCIPEIFGEKQSGRRQILDQLYEIEWIQHIFLFPLFTLMLIVYKF